MAAQQRQIPFGDGMALGLGIDDLTGDVGAVRGVSFQEVESALGDEGMEATYETRLTFTAEQVYSTLGVTVNAEGRYGLFQAEGKFAFAEQSQFNSQPTFLVARSQLSNAFRRAVDPTPTEDAKGLVSNGHQDIFRQRYGDLFISGIKSGGEYIAVISITSSESSEQQTLAIALKASFDAIAAGGQVDSQLSSDIQELRQRSEVRVATFNVVA